MEWLEEILGTVEGADKLLTKIKDGIGKNFVAKSDFNSKSQELKDSKAKVESLEKTLGESGDATKKLAELQSKYDTDTKALTDQIGKIKFDAVVDGEIAKVGAKNLKALKALLNLDAVKVDDKGAVTGLEDQVKKLRESDAYLFERDISKRGTQPGIGDPPSDGKESLGAQIAKAQAINGKASYEAFQKAIGIGNN